VQAKYKPDFHKLTKHEFKSLNVKRKPRNRSLKTIIFKEKPDPRTRKKTKLRASDYLKAFFDFVCGRAKRKSKILYRKERMMLKRIG
jgi:hypothetical protein